MSRSLSPPPRGERLTTFWHGHVAAATWSSHNIASITENGLADITLTFHDAYRATPAAFIGAGVGIGTHLQGSFTTMGTGSCRVVTRNGSNGATSAGKTSVIITGLV